MSGSDRPRVVIVGAGFGGLWAARALARAPVDLIVVDQNNYHLFLPLLYQVAAAELEPDTIAYPVRSILRAHPNARFVMATATGLDPGRRIVWTDGPSIPFDYLLIATGSISHDFGIPGAAAFALPLKTLDQGIVIRNHILRRFELAMHEADAARRRSLRTVVIAGGGPTGVEFAGALAELIRGPFVRDYPTLDFREARVLLVEVAESLLPGFPERCRSYARERLCRLGVEVRLASGVSRISRNWARLQDGTTIPTETVVWTAGVRGDAPFRSWGLPIGRKGQVLVLPTLQVPGHPEIYVVGDLAHVEQDGRPLPMVAPVAIQEGTLAARNIRRQILGVPPVTFRYRDSGMMLTLGRNAALAHIGTRSFFGFPAWIVWLTVHLVQLIGFRNRLLVLINWAWDYLFFDKAIRLIVPRQKDADHAD